MAVPPFIFSIVKNVINELLPYVHNVMTDECD